MMSNTLSISKKELFNIFEKSKKLRSMAIGRYDKFVIYIDTEMMILESPVFSEKEVFKISEKYKKTIIMPLQNGVTYSKSFESENLVGPTT